MSLETAVNEYHTAERKTMPCQLFLLCENEATTTRPGPQFVDGKPQIVEVPACERCAEKMDRISAMD